MSPLYYYGIKLLNVGERVRVRKRAVPTEVQLRLRRCMKLSSYQSHVPFNIHAIDIPTPAFCSLLGIELNYESNRRQDDSAEVDKIIPALGYVPDNIQVISKKANRMKSNASIEELLHFSRAVLGMFGDQEEKDRYETIENPPPY